jgi:AraC-like DNA-binding protein
MSKITTYNCERINSQKLFISDLKSYLQDENSYLHFIKGALLCFCRKGEIQIKVNYTTFKLNENDILVILPTHMFYIEQYSENVVIEAILYSDEYWASISHSIDYKLIKAVEQNPYSSISEEHFDEVFTLLDLIKKHETAEKSSTLNPELERSVAGGLAFSLLMLLVSIMYIAKADMPHPVTRKEVLTHDFFQLLSQYYETQRQVSFYASKLFVTPKHLSTMVKEVTHLPIQEWINNVTILNIKHRLLTSTDTVLQISEDLNFQTPSTFVRYFRQHTGITPSKYRNTHEFSIITK